MLDTVAYGAFCQRVAGDYLHHTPHYGEPHSYHDPGYAAPREAGHARTGASLSLVLVTGYDGLVVTAHHTLLGNNPAQIDTRCDVPLPRWQR